MAYTKKTRTPYKKMYIKGKYEDFTDFYDINKKSIYENILEVFYGFKDNKKRVLTLYIQAIIQGLEWDTEFKFNRTDTIVLTRDVLPYFESIQQLTCLSSSHLNHLHKSLPIITLFYGDCFTFGPKLWFVHNKNSQTVGFRIRLPKI